MRSALPAAPSKFRPVEMFLITCTSQPHIESRGILGGGGSDAIRPEIGCTATCPSFGLSDVTVSMRGSGYGSSIGHEHREGMDIGLRHDEQPTRAASATEWKNTKRRIEPSCPYHLVAVEATTMDCASIILPITPPELLAAAISTGLRPNCSAVIFCRLPNRTFETYRSR